LEVGAKEIRTPAFFLGFSLGHLPEPWKLFPVPGLMVNAYTIANDGFA